MEVAVGMKTDLKHTKSANGHVSEKIEDKRSNPYICKCLLGSTLFPRILVHFDLANRYLCKTIQDLLDMQHLVKQSNVVCLANSYTTYPRSVVNFMNQLTARNIQDF